MTRKLQTGLAFILLLVAISCTKENDNSPFSSSGSSKSLTSSSADDAVGKEVDARFNFGGVWVLHWSWSCGPKSSVSINFRTNGTLTDGFGEAGVWTAGAHSILWKFNGREDHWTGHDIAGGSVDGIMADFSFDNSHGCLTLTRSALSAITEITKGSTSRGGQ